MCKKSGDIHWFLPDIIKIKKCYNLIGQAHFGDITWFVYLTNKTLWCTTNQKYQSQVYNFFGDYLYVKNVRD